MDSVLESDVRMFVLSSSCAVYGLHQSLPICESSPKEPINPYGASKLFFERVLSAYSVSHNLRFVALRYFNAAGTHPVGMIGQIHNPETHFLPLAIRAALGVTPPLTTFGKDLDTQDGTCVRDFVHVADLSSAHVKALEYLARGGPPIELNLGSGTGTSIKQLIREIEEISGRSLPHTHFRTPERSLRVWMDMRNELVFANSWSMSFPRNSLMLGLIGLKRSHAKAALTTIGSGKLSTIF